MLNMSVEDSQGAVEVQADSLPLQSSVEESEHQIEGENETTTEEEVEEEGPTVTEVNTAQSSPSKVRKALKGALTFQKSSHKLKNKVQWQKNK